MEIIRAKPFAAEAKSYTGCQTPNFISVDMLVESG
jgi:hypothetical protein